ATAVFEPEASGVGGMDAQPPAAVALHQLRHVVQPAVVRARIATPDEPEGELRRLRVVRLARQAREFALDLRAAQVDAPVGGAKLPLEDSGGHAAERHAVRRRRELAEIEPSTPGLEPVATRTEANHRVDYPARGE